MPITIYNISKKLGLENKEVLAKAKELGITAAKVPSSSLDKITAEYLEEKLTGGKPVAATPPTPAKTVPTNPAPPEFAEPVATEIVSLKSPIIVSELADQLKRKPFQIIADLMQLDVYVSVNAAIDEEIAKKICAKYGFRFEVEARKQGGGIPEGEKRTSPPQPSIVITATGAELYRLVERILSGAVQVHFDVSEDEHSEPLRVVLTKDGPKSLEETKSKPDLPPRREIDERTKRLLRTAYYTSTFNSEEEWVNLAVYGNAIKKLDPRFQPQDYGERSLGSLLRRVPELFDLRNDEANPIVYFLRMKGDVTAPAEKSAGRPVLQCPPDQVTPFVALSSRPAITSPPAKLAKGKVHNLRLGFGFIMPDDGSENLFFHATDVEGCTIFDLKPGDAVEYEPGINEKGPCARKVRRLT